MHNSSGSTDFLEDEKSPTQLISYEIHKLPLEKERTNMKQIQTDGKCAHILNRD